MTKRIVSALLALMLIVCAGINPAHTVHSEADVYAVSPTLCNPAPSEEAQQLMNWLCEEYGQRMISGQYLEEGQRGNELNAIAKVTDGLYPALVGLDLINYSPSSVALGARGSAVDQALKLWQAGHIITLCWHWRAPEKYLNSRNTSWWGGFYTENTSFDLGKALSGEDPEGKALLLRDMDAIARQLTVLRDAGVPILWRPLHEASGGWFWWGASGAEAYLDLYRMMYERFTNEFRLNNLIWVWNGQDAAWYPGDDMVDIIGEDIYAGNHVHDVQKKAFKRCQSYTQANKLIMLSECGCIPSPIACARENVMWSSWCVWCYEYVQVNGQYNEAFTTAELLKRFYELDNVITLNDVPAFGREPLAEPEEGDALSFSFKDAAFRGAVQVAGDWVEIRGNAQTDGLALKFSVPESGAYRLVVHEAGIGGYKENYLSVDGQAFDNLTVQGMDEEDTLAAELTLEAGEHTLDITAFWGWVRLETLTLIPLEKEANE